MQSYAPGLPEKIALGADLIVKLTAEDLTETATATAQVIPIYTAKPGQVVGVAGIFLKTPLKDASDAAFNDCALQVGDTGDADRLLTSTQLNENGTEVIHKAGTGGHMYATETAVNATVGSMTAKALSNIDVGEVYIALTVKDTKAIGNFA